MEAEENEWLRLNLVEFHQVDTRISAEDEKKRTRLLKKKGFLSSVGSGLFVTGQNRV